MSYFFATPEDLLPVLLSIESHRQIKYTRYGHISEPTIESYATAKDLPTLFLPAPHESAVAGPSYVVTEFSATIALRRLSPRLGGERWAVDQLANPDSTVLQHGGLYGERILLRGEVRTAYKSSVATSLQRTFDRAIRKSFSKVRSFYVGSHAEALLDAGCRLTAAKQSPPEYDLHR
jgi:hypothetical protein